MLSQLNPSIIPEEKISVNKDNFKEFLIKNEVDDPSDLLNGISGLFVREIKNMKEDQEEPSILEYAHTKVDFWRLITSSLLNKFNPRNKIFV